MKSLTVVKFGGSLMENLLARNKFIRELARVSQKQNIILVHGGGHDINIMLKKFSISCKFVNGLRFTDAETMDIVEMVLSGKVNRNLTTSLIKNGANAIGISGKDGNSIVCRRIRQYGFVGEPVNVNKRLIDILIKARFLPVMASVASDVKGNTVNVNADIFAASVAVAFGVHKLVFLTDVPGVLNKNRNTIKEIKVGDIDALIKNGTVKDGMIPKIKSCADSINKGVREVWIVDGRSGIQEMEGTVIRK